MNTKYTLPEEEPQMVAEDIAATFTEDDGNEDILDYFNLEVKNWKI